MGQPFCPNAWREKELPEFPRTRHRPCKGKGVRLIKDLLFWLLWNPARWTLLRLPLPVVLTGGRVLGSVLALAPTGARAAMERAAKAVLGPDAPCQEIRTAARRGIFNLVMNETEALLFPRMTPQSLPRFIGIEGLERLDEAVAQGRGVVLLVAHFGANQMVMAAIGHSGRRICQISAPAMVLDEKMPGRRSHLFRAALATRWTHEQSLPVTHINVFGPLTNALHCLRTGGILAVAVDGGHGANPTPAPFLGRTARFNTGALELAVHTGSPVLPVFVIRGRNGRNTLVIGPPLICDGPEDMPRKAAAEAALGAYVPVLERYVRQHPDHYLRFLAFRELMAAAGEEPFFAPEPARSTPC
nr:lysophospholipid acyltransferase family protein [Desulfolutivibrio sulfodismutans]